MIRIISIHIVKGISNPDENGEGRGRGSLAKRGEAELCRYIYIFGNAKYSEMRIASRIWDK